MMKQSRAASAPECTVFLVDDDENARNALEFLLQAEGFTVRCYSCAEEFLDEIYLPINSCLVTDYNMQGMDGLDLVAALRGQGNLIPAILITGYPSSSVRNRAIAGDVPVIGKPDYENRLPECIWKVMNARPVS
jgi:FixJ family two-component response regulator